MHVSDSLATLLLTNRIVDVGVKPLSAREFWSVKRSIGDVSALAGLNAVEMYRRTGISTELAERIALLFDAAISFTIARDQLETSGIRVRSYLDDEYPARLSKTLGERSPIFLLIAGNPSLLDNTMRGIVGSRSVGTASMEVAAVAARRAVKRGDIVTSGLARGIDQTAMGAALGEDVGIVGLPTEGIRRITQDPKLRQLVFGNQICLLSPYGPDAPFSVGNAMGRNKLIYGLAESTLVVTSDFETGGTWSGAVEALRGRFADVDVWLGDGMGEGNVALVDKGARPIREYDDLWSDRLTQTTSGGPDAEQLELEM
jgi:predicted Rossmann fold nucleotide-binding protein DprA/Smf involved in DNA uptake